MNNMEHIKEYHEKAMLLAEEAFLAQQAKEETAAQQLYQQAFELAKQAAMQLVTNYSEEPTRSVLFKSAASLALNAQQFTEAERMAGFGLAGYPPMPIAQELKALLLDTIQANQHSANSPMEKFQQLPQHLQNEVATFIDFLLTRHQIVIS